MKILAVLMVLGLFQATFARADEEISCATDDQCQRDKVDAGYKEFQRSQAREARHAKKHKSHKPKDEEQYVPCAASDDCQRSKLDAIDHANGENVED